MRTRTYGLDRDTIAYANRIKVGSGKVLDSNAIKQINRFVVGMKRMRLWNSMICWPTRSIHNAGTGSIVYNLGSMGRSGIYTGTIINGLTWGVNGLYGDVIGYLNCGILGLYGSFPQSVIFVGKWNSVTSSSCAFGSGGFQSDRAINHTSGSSSYRISVGSSVSTAARTLSLGTIACIAGTWTGSTVTQYLNGGSKQTASGAVDVTISGNTYFLGNWNAGGNSGGGGLLSFGMVLNVVLSDSDIINIYTLYRQTLGQNLQLS